jgi:hypothetical protein
MTAFVNNGRERIWKGPVVTSFKVQIRKRPALVRPAGDRAEISTQDLHNTKTHHASRNVLSDGRANTSRVQLSGCIAAGPLTDSCCLESNLPWVRDQIVTYSKHLRAFSILDPPLHAGREVHTKTFWWETLNERNHSKNQGLDHRWRPPPSHTFGSIGESFNICLKLLVQRKI